MKHFLQAHCLCAELNLVFHSLTQRAVLILDGVEFYRKLHSRDMASSCIHVCFDTVAFSKKQEAV